MIRHAKVPPQAPLNNLAFLNLARAFAANFEGMTLDEMAALLGSGGGRRSLWGFIGLLAERSG